MVRMALPVLGDVGVSCPISPESSMPKVVFKKEDDRRFGFAVRNKAFANIASGFKRFVAASRSGDGKVAGNEDRDTAGIDEFAGYNLLAADGTSGWRTFFSPPFHFTPCKHWFH
jgi:hypothetical protein